ncbi:MAG: Rha family transcriptional regulator [Magnetococcales bacterium]|nr:Rha family transcriptional regulator [Magnetococcales bacterium]MBF0150019.1 Rha family transcriptional regulator [Magnetococcales bacterium]MBF0629535.1 Rha family transcriptional regulator [Magnetococcales bacterium]
MQNLIVPIHLEISNGRPTARSTDVAEHFEKRHDNVLRNIRGLEIPDEWRLLNFEETYIQVKTPNGGTRMDPAIDMTRDGFTVLVMGWTGAKAMQFKIAYLEAFNRMEAELQTRAGTLPTHRHIKLLERLAELEAFRAETLAQRLENRPHRSPRPLTPEERTRMTAMHQQGFSLYRIARETGRHTKTVARAIR